MWSIARVDTAVVEYDVIERQELDGFDVQMTS
jgi:hypothetical protein